MPEFDPVKWSEEQTTILREVGWPEEEIPQRIMFGLADMIAFEERFPHVAWDPGAWYHGSTIGYHPGDVISFPGDWAIRVQGAVRSYGEEN